MDPDFGDKNARRTAIPVSPGPRRMTAPICANRLSRHGRPGT